MACRVVNWQALMQVAAAIVLIATNVNLNHIKNLMFV
jgi:hypothetical protein